MKASVSGAKLRKKKSLFSLLFSMQKRELSVGGKLSSLGKRTQWAGFPLPLPLFEREQMNGAAMEKPCFPPKNKTAPWIQSMRSEAVFSFPFNKHLVNIFAPLFPDQEHCVSVKWSKSALWSKSFLLYRGNFGTCNSVKGDSGSLRCSGLFGKARAIIHFF